MVCKILWQYESLDRDWHPQYLVAIPPSPNFWGIPNTPLFSLPRTEKLSQKFHNLKTWEEEVFHELLRKYHEDHEMMKPLLLSEEVLSFFGLKLGTPWNPLMGNYALQMPFFYL